MILFIGFCICVLAVCFCFYLLGDAISDLKVRLHQAETKIDEIMRDLGP